MKIPGLGTGDSGLPAAVYVYGTQHCSSSSRGLYTDFKIPFHTGGYADRQTHHCKFQRTVLKKKKQPIKKKVTSASYAPTSWPTESLFSKMAHSNGIL